jgi:nicotinamidase-related amidase
MLVVDMQLHFLGDPASTAAVDANAKLLAESRDRGIPIFLAKMGFETEAEASHAWRRTRGAQALVGRDSPAAAFHPKLGLDGSDSIVRKRHASAFAGTDLDARLKNLGVDTILLTGTSTSGCVRATAVDGSALLYRVLVVEDAVHDARRISGAVALFDLASRYADVISLAEALDILGPAGFRRAPAPERPPGRRHRGHRPDRSVPATDP